MMHHITLKGTAGQDQCGQHDLSFMRSGPTQRKCAQMLTNVIVRFGRSRDAVFSQEISDLIGRTEKG